MTGGAVHDRRSMAVAAVVAVVAVVVVANLARSLVVPGSWHFWFNVGLGVAVAALGLGARLTAEEIGLGRGIWAGGLRLGAMVFTAITIVVVVVALTPGLQGLLDDGRTTVSTGRMLQRVLVLIPIGTVVMEEVVFRGVLFGLARRLTTTARAMVAVSVLFGLWHLLPVWRSAGGEGLADGGGSRGLAVVGTFAVTFAAGMGFAWLRTRSGSLIAPIAAHLATNSVTFAAAWAVAR